jgi:hypothetical protein
VTERDRERPDRDEEEEKRVGDSQHKQSRLSSTEFSEKYSEINL